MTSDHPQSLPSEEPPIEPSAPPPEDDMGRLTMRVATWYAVVGLLRASRSLQLTIPLSCAGERLTLHLYSSETSGELFFLLLEEWLRGGITSLTMEGRD